MSRSGIRKSNISESLQMETLEEKRLLTTSPINVPETPLDASSYIAEIDTLAEQELVVRQFLAGNQETNYLQQGDSDVRLVEVKYGAGGIYNRFMQTWNGIDVYDSWVSVNQGVDGTVQQVFHEGYDNLEVTGVNAKLTAVDQMMAERAALRKLDADSTFAESKANLVWQVGEKGQASLAWQLTVYPNAPLGDYLTIVDAATNEVLHQENRMAFATGNGDVFIPNPYQTQGSGAGLDDNGDANSPALDAQLISVTLERLDDGTGLIMGDWVDLATLNSDTLPDVDADEADRQYFYNRDDDRFEQVVIYHAVDSMNAYFHSLGFDDDSGAANGIRDFPTLANAHWFTADNSFYSGGNDAIHFGDGGVDDGEDADIVAHEYGHAVQNDQNAAWGGGEMGAMGEGFGDYLAASFYFDAGDATYQSTNAACVGDWDATSYSTTDPPCLRRVDGDKTYPDDTGGGVHADGEIWSRALWDIRAAIGGPTADQVILESHFSVPANATMPQAAEQVLLADQNLNGGANQAEIRQAFVDRGILEAPATEGEVTLSQSVYNVPDTIEITVEDANAIAPIVVDVVASNGDTESVTLVDQGGGFFFGTIDTVEGAPSNGDGMLQVALDDLVDVTYNDPDDGTGNSSTSMAQARIGSAAKYSSNDTPIPIVSNTTITSTIEITDVALVADLNVQIDITHTFDADLDVFLIAPDGTRVELFTDVGGAGDDFTGTTLDDEAATAIVDGAAPFTGEFSPEGILADFIGINILGTWTLEVTDDAGGDEGTLNSWALCIETSDASEGQVEFDRETYDSTDLVTITVVDANAVAPVTVDVTSTSGDTETVTLVDQGGGLHDFTITTAEGAAAGNDGVLQVAVGDTIEVTYIDLDDGTGSSQTLMDTASITSLAKYDSTDIPVGITSNTTVTSTIEISDVALVANLDVALDITHTFDADLDVFLIAPDGTRVELFTDVGGAGDNFTETVLDDEAPTAITAGSAPFTGSFSPEGNLADLVGTNIAGTWTLEITDDAGGDEGTLNSWSLCIETSDAGAGQLDLDKDVYNLTDVAEITVVDGNAVAPVTVDVTTTSGDTETLTLTDQGLGIWSIMVNIDDGAVTNDDGTLQVAVGDIIEVTYIDLDDGSGNMQTVMDTATVAEIKKFENTTPSDIVSNTTVLSNINVTDNGLIQDLNVQLDITHTFTADLDIFLIAPDGTRIELMQDVGGAGDNFTDTVLDDEATTSIGSGVAPFTGSFVPVGSLAVVDGLSISGNWTLEVTDDAGGDEGTLNSWALCFATVLDPSIQFVDLLGPATIVESDAGGLEAVYTIMLDEPANSTKRVDYSTFDGTATGGADYTTVTGFAEFTLGMQTIDVVVPVSDDFIAEDLETFSFEIFNPISLNIGISSIVTEIVDNDIHAFGTLIDFGTQDSPVEAGAVGVVDLAYDAVHGMGWEPGAVNLTLTDTGIGTDVQRDIAIFQNATFLVDAAVDGDYDVTIEFGDSGTTRVTSVVIEGQNFGSIPSMAGEFTTQTFSVPVSDGQITIELGGSAFGFGAITSMVVTGPASVDPTATKFLDGSIDSGTLADIAESDDTRLELITSPTLNPVKQKIDVIFLAETTELNPSAFSFRLEAAMSGGPVGDVMQRIEIFDFVGQVWEVADSRPASDVDLIVEGAGTGDLSRFVDQGASEVLARVIWETPLFSGSPFFWNVSVDEAGWIIGEADSGSNFNKSGSSGSDGSIARSFAEMTKPEQSSSSDEAFIGRSMDSLENVATPVLVMPTFNAIATRMRAVDIRDNAVNEMFDADVSLEVEELDFDHVMLDHSFAIKG